MTCLNLSLQARLLALSFLSAVFKSFTKARYGRLIVPARPMITKSRPLATITGKTSSATARSLRRTRLRMTEFPTFFVTVKPTRTASASISPCASCGARLRTCRTSPATAHFRPCFAALKNSCRCFNRNKAGATWESSGHNGVVSETVGSAFKLTDVCVPLSVGLR